MSNKPKGTLIKTISGRRDNGFGTLYDYVMIIYRDENGKKQTKFIDRAELEYYIIKDKDSAEAAIGPKFIEKQKVEKVTVFSDMLFRDIASKTNSMFFYDKVSMENGENSYEMRNLFKHNYIYDADMDIEDQYIARFNNTHDPDMNYKVHKTYFDIEVDLMPDGFVKNSKGQIGYVGFPDEDLAPCPINIITLIDGKHLNSYTFIHENKKNKSLLEFKSKIEEFKEYLYNKMKEEDEVDMKGIFIDFYDDEIDVIKAYFNKLHEVDPDFTGAWNLSFDVLTIKNRLIQLLKKDKSIKDPIEEANYIMSDKSILSQTSSVTGNEINIRPNVYYRPERNQPIYNRFDTCNITDKITWIDSMTTFASIRRPQGVRDSYSLNAIAYEELGKEKLEFEVGETIKTLPWFGVYFR